MKKGYSKFDVNKYLTNKEIKKAYKKAKSEEWKDPDDAPELTEEWFRKADRYEYGKLVKRGERDMSDLLREYQRLQTQAWQVYFNILGMWGMR